MGCINGKRVYTGVSRLTDEVGEDLFDEVISLVDDATLDGCFGSVANDGEAVPES